MLLLIIGPAISDVKLFYLAKPEASLFELWPPYGKMAN
jgi:hypothetical protein